MNLKIPKRIIQTGKSVDLPLLSKAAAVNVRLLNPDFEYMFFDNNGVDQFIDKHFPEYRGIFDTFRFPIQRYDFFRYLAVYHFGGFYFDLDVFMALNLADLLEHSCVFPYEGFTISTFLREEYGMDWEVGNYAFGAAPGHPFIRQIIDNCIRTQKEPEWAEVMLKPIPKIFRASYYVLYTTGPGLVSRTLAEYPDAYEQVKVLFPNNVWDTSSLNRFGNFGVHRMEGTWRKPMNIFRRNLTSLWDFWTMKKLLKESLRLGETRSLEFKRRV
jgi:inositol phosphorylceramide mannosyltransferase catalytic subunit